MINRILATLASAGPAGLTAATIGNRLRIATREAQSFLEQAPSGTVAIIRGKRGAVRYVSASGHATIDTTYSLVERRILHVLAKQSATLATLSNQTPSIDHNDMLASLDALIFEGVVSSRKTTYKKTCYYLADPELV